MTRVSNENLSQYWEPVGIGPVAQVDLSASNTLKADGSLPTTGTIGAAGSYQSIPVYVDGHKAIGIGCKSTQTGNITIQRFLDTAGNVPVGAVLTAALTAATAQWLSVNDGVPFQSFSFNISNTGGVAATITNFALLLQAA